ncbi:MAG: hypothetical protein ACKOX6_16870 [Bdellovibrio sp.]
MTKFTTLLKYDKASDGGEAGGSSSSTGYETPPAETPAPNAAPPETPGNLDEHGYEKADAPNEPGKEGSGEKKEGKETPAKAEKKEEQPNSVSGYGDDHEDPAKEDEPVKEEKNEEIKADEGLGYELDVKDLDAKEAEKIQAFAKTHKLSQEAAQAFIEMKKSEIASAKQFETERQAALEKEIKVTKAKWVKELQTDKEFGGEAFKQNVFKVEKLLSEFLPNTRKILTERNSMLPPYVMRDLSKLANHLFAPDKLVTGDENDSSDTDTSKNSNDHLDFYN